MAKGKYKEKSKNSKMIDNNKSTTETELCNNRIYVEDVNNEIESVIKYKTILSYVFFYITIFGFILFTYVVSELDLNYTIFIYFIPVYYLSMLKLYGYTIKEITINFVCILSFYNFFLEFNPLNMIEVSSNYYISNILYFYISFIIVSFNFKIYERLSNVLDIIYGQLIYLKSNPLIAYPILGITLFFYSWAAAIIFKLLNFHEIVSLILGLLLWIIIAILFICMLYHWKKQKKEKYTILKYLEKKINLKRNEEKINKSISYLLDIINIKRLGETKKIEHEEKEERDKLRIFIHVALIKITKLYPIIVFIMLMNNYSYYGMYLIKNETYCKKSEKVNEQINENTLIVKLKNGDVFRSLKDPEKKYSFILDQIPCETKKYVLKVTEGGEKGAGGYKIDN